jgi:IS30 family transposase
MGKIYNQLSIEDRAMIQTQLEMGNNPSAIALVLNRSVSTISRELKRNSWVRPKTRIGPGRPLLAGGYRFEAAHKRAHACTAKPRVERRLRPTTALWEHVMGYLESGFFSRTDFWYTDTCPSRHAPIASISRNHLHCDLRHAAW